jgi:glycerophosphoryl diester phosphodiesterase
MLVIAHRGANREALENSWEAFERAIDGGATRIELDVHLTADGHAVVIHDEDLRRTTGAPGRLSEMSRAEVAKRRLANGEAIPFLDETCERLLPRVELNVEIKGRSERLAAAVAELTASHPRREGVIVSCFHLEPLAWLREHAPDLQRACLWGRDTFEWPRISLIVPQVFLDAAGTKILHPCVDLVDENLMDQAQSRGWTVYAWAPMVGEERDREGLWATMKTLGLHGLCTNYPRQLVGWLAEAAIDEQLYRPHS